MTNRFQIAGKEFLKGNLGNALYAITNKHQGSQLVQPSTYRNGNFFFGVNGADKAFVWGNYNSSLIAYQQCPVVFAIINRKAIASITGVIKVVDETGKESNTLEAKGIRNLFKKPNNIQSGKQFRAQSKVYQQIYGYCPILIFKPVGFEKDISTWTMWNLPPWMVEVEDSNEIFFNTNATPFKSIKLTYGGYSTELPKECMFFLKETQISTYSSNSYGNGEMQSFFLPSSKLHSLSEPISNIIDAYNSRGSLIRERGPMWILSNDQNDTGDAGLFPTDPKIKEVLHNDFKQNYGITKGQKKAIITDAKLKLQTAGFNVGELKLHEEEVQSAKAICDVLNYPSNLLGLLDSKYDNMHIAERGLFQNAIIPEMESDCEQWESFFGIDLKGLSIKIDYSHLQVFQANKVEEGKAMQLINSACLIAWQSDLITWNEWRVKLSMNPVLDMDKYRSELIKEGRITDTTTAFAPVTDNQNNNNA